MSLNCWIGWKRSQRWVVVGGVFLGIRDKEDENGVTNYSFSGKAQKGPFITGTTINLNELNTDLGQTGKSFTTSISTDDGSFHLNNIELSSDLVLITANGFYFSEIYGKLSSAPISLQVLADLTDKETININLDQKYI